MVSRESLEESLSSLELTIHRSLGELQSLRDQLAAETQRADQAEARARQAAEETERTARAWADDHNALEARARRLEGVLLFIHNAPLADKTSGSWWLGVGEPRIRAALTPVNPPSGERDA